MLNDRLWYELSSPIKNGDSIFIQHIVKILKDGGRCGVIVPEGFLFRRELRNTRKYLLEKCSLDAIISLPSGVFMPYTGVKTDVLIFTKGIPTKKVWYFNVENDGFELNVSRRRLDGKNDIDELLSIWEHKEVTEKSWFVDIEDIEKRDFNLSVRKIIKSNENIQIKDPKELIEDSIRTERIISKELEELKKLIR